tara:strand:+ start:1468 stop:1836 length:369 start_codon:yes stop_codon:yes gene_type:complete
MVNFLRRIFNLFRGYDEESVCVSDKLISVIKDVNKEAFRAELQNDTQVNCREIYGDYGIDVTPDIFFRNKRRVARFIRKYGNRHSKSSMKSKTYKVGGKRGKQSIKNKNKRAKRGTVKKTRC